MSRKRCTPARIKIGTAGWANPANVKASRTAGQSHLEYYASQFSCVEINSTFYRSHRSDTYARWHASTPHDFRFSVKLPRSITHESGLKGVKRETRTFIHEIGALGDKLEVLLIQLPPTQAFSAPLARGFFRSVPRLSGNMKLVCEPRHASWFSPAADAVLVESGVARVAADPPRFELADTPGGTRRFAYFRWHGSPRMYYSSYTPAQLADLAHRLASGPTETWCIFDNTARGAAWPNALSLAVGLQRSRI